MLTVDRLKELLFYDPNTGGFVWRVERHPGNGKRNGPGSVAGTMRGRGTENPYIVIWIDGVLYRAHRLVWLYVFGRLPHDNIDHINGDGCDNRLANLRECNQQQNNGNHKRLNNHNTSGYRGVTWKKDRAKWKAYINRNNRQYHVGYFDTAEAAYEAYKVAAVEHFGEFARV